MATTKKTATSTVIGANVKAVPKIKAEIDNYKVYVRKQTDISATKSEIRKAVKGSNSESNLEKLSKQLESTLESYLSSFDQFKTALDSWAATYKKIDSDNTAYNEAANKLKNG